VKVNQLLGIVASQVCVFDNPKIVAISPSQLFSGVTLTVEGEPIGLFKPVSQFITAPNEIIIQDLNHLDERLRGFDPKARIGWHSVGSPQFKIGFLDYHEGWVETVTSDELGLSEDPK
tara:strand:- start:305 stop:658 length:354 start_codon:yes stop_codon:yes gene_type:complete